MRRKIDVWMVDDVERTRKCHGHYEVVVIVLCMWWEDDDGRGEEEGERLGREY